MMNLVTPFQVKPQINKHISTIDSPSMEPKNIKDQAFLLIYHGLRDNPCSSLRNGVENPCSSVQDGVVLLSLGITVRLIPAHLTMFDEKECYSSHLNISMHPFQKFQIIFYPTNVYSKTNVSI